MAGAIWFYMTPQTPKPSMHDIVVGHWEANSEDLAAGITAGFGATVNVINGGLECRATTEAQQVLWRVSYYESFMDHFGIDIPSDE